MLDGSGSRFARCAPHGGSAGIRGRRGGLLSLGLVRFPTRAALDLTGRDRTARCLDLQAGFAPGGLDGAAPRHGLGTGCRRLRLDSGLGGRFRTGRALRLMLGRWTGWLHALGFGLTVAW